MCFANQKHTKNIATNATTARIRRARSSIRWSISGARDASISSSTPVLI
jgi:hypothetical protein